MREVEIEYPVGSIDFDEAISRISSAFDLPIIKKGMTHVRDMYLDTDSFHLLKSGCSFRVRLKLEDVYQGAHLRLTFKYPLERHESMLIREELKLKLLADDFSKAAGFFGSAAKALIGEDLTFKLIVEETSNEAYLGDSAKKLNVAFDRVKFIHPADPEKKVLENFFEIEDHGIGEEKLLQIGAKLEELYNLVPCTETKYRRGLRLLGLYSDE